MRKRTCSVKICDRPAISRGWCKGHYSRWRRLGEVQPDVPLIQYYSDPETAFAARTTRRADGCLVWTGANTRGYGRIRAHNSSYLAHRYAWERENGPIPDGMYVDHRCWTKACVAIEHLRLASHSENARYRDGADPSNKASGVRNVYRNGRRWMVQVKHKGRLNYFGTFDTIEEAAPVAGQARRDLFGDFAGA